jgi:hypothetical protein
MASTNGALYLLACMVEMENNVPKGDFRVFYYDHLFCDLCIRSRYTHQLSPDIVKDPWTKEEDLAIIHAQS